MSKNFELLRRAQSSIGELRTLPNTVTPVPFTESSRDARSNACSEWVHALYVLWKHRRLSLWFAVSVLALVAAVTGLMRPVYEPAATVEVSPPGTEAFSMQNGYSLTGDSEYLETESKNLRSDLLAIRVIRELHLDQNPDFVGRGLLGTVLGPVTTLSSKIAVRRPHGRVGQQLPADIPNLTSGESHALSIFQDRLAVQRDVQSRLIQVSFSSHDPRLSALVLDTLIKDFIDSAYESRHNAVVQASQWLSKQLEDVRKRMDDSNRALAQFQKTTGIADVDTNKSTISEEMAEQARQLAQAQIEANQLKAYLDRVRTGDPELLPQTGTDPVVQQLAAKLAQARADLAQAEPVYGGQHPLMKRLQNQVQEFQTQLNQQRSAILAQLKTSYAAAQAKKQLASAQIKDTSRQMTQLAEYNNLKREAQVNASLFNSLFAKIKEAGIEAEAKSSNILVVSPPRVLEKPTRPSWPLNLALGFAVAVVGGLLIPFVVERFDNKVYDIEQIRENLGTSSMSIVPAAHGELCELPSRSWRLHLVSKATAPSAFVLKHPDSPESEAISALYTSILLRSRSGSPEVLLVASALPGEGKTTIATNLAIALAAHRKTCIVDADLRRSSVARALQIPENAGLAGLLSGQTELDQVLTEVPDVPQLSLLCGGPTVHNPIKLILSERMREVLMVLRQRYDFVIMDSPPVLPYTDARMLAVFADEVVFVSRFGSTTFEAIHRGLELLTSAEGAAPITEVVLNCAEKSSLPYRYMYGRGVYG